MKRLLATTVMLTQLFLGQASAGAAECSRPPGSLPDPASSAGTPNADIPIEHMVVIMQENHSFDSYFGGLDSPKYFGSEVDGLTDELSNPDQNGDPVYPFHEGTLCIKDPPHSWDDQHRAWNGGRNDRFARLNGKRAMGYYDESDIPYYYALANRFAIADRYFSPVMGPTFPNRYFLLAGTAFGHIENDGPASGDQFSQKTLFDRLDQYGISWKYYRSTSDYLELFQPLYKRDRQKIVDISEFQKDLAQGRLPQIALVESSEIAEDEHPPANIHIGQAWVASQVNELLASAYWKNSVLFFTYDENGGLFDHVPPPEACAPDGIAPKLKPGSFAAAYHRYGFRVPFIAVSPYVKRHYVSHLTYDHSSILKFIETKFNLPALTRRDANANSLLDLFDFSRRDLSVPTLPTVQAKSKGTCVPDGS